MDESLRTPEQLQASDSHHRRVVELIHEAIWIHSDGRVVFANPQAAVMFGCKSPDDLIGRGAIDLVHPDDRQRAIERSRILTALGEAVPLTEMRFLSNDGRTVTLEVQAVPFMHEGRRSVLAVGRDISERIRAGQALRESEARFRTLADTLPALLWMRDKDGKSIFVNSRWIEYTGRTFEDELGDGFAENIHPDQRRSLADLERSMLVEHKPITSEYMLRSKEGKYRWFLDTAVPRHSADGSYLGHVGVLIDIDERRRLEDQLRQAQKMETVGQLTGGMAHDFNNLLTVIVGVLELAVERAGQELRPGLWLALQASERGVELIKRLLAFSRQQMLVPEKLDFNFIAREMETLLRRTLGEQIDIEFKLHPELWPAHADRGQVESALLNLAVNARDAMPAGGKLTIETKHESLDAGYAAHNAEVRPGDYVVLAVSDTGRGMSPEVLQHAMEPFFTTKEVGKGSGLGLSMIYGFAKQSGGHLKIYSEPGHGTTVRLYLPRQLAPGAVEAPPVSTAADLPHGNEAILVVEDQADVRLYVVTQLQDFGYRVVEATDGPQALKILQGDAPIDLLFTDLVMAGGMTGQKLAAEATRLRPKLKVLFTSGYTENSAAHQGKLDPGVNFLPKPYRRKDLARIIRDVLDSSK